MKSNNKFIEIRMKKRTCYYFDNIFKFEDFDINNIFIDKIPGGNILVYNISHNFDG